ncbi:protein AUXIN RESPONSE 4 [Mercurialis annua]|uniref:protein AUXIN RESPONSE 4 n=1 Tax=Mercurialis annua TaxID=3986 RepID=UPI00215DD9CC|nr:protein AUXIN RESPONSE 4 [Mercurialis annua]
MAIITEEQEPDQNLRNRKPKKQQTSPQSKPNKSEITTQAQAQAQTQTQTQTQTNPFVFWFYLTLTVSLVTLLTITLSSLTSSSSDPKSFFLSLSPPLRHHYSQGRTIKAHLAKNQPPTEIFTVESGKLGSLSEKVVIVHGFGLSSFSYKKVLSFLNSNGVHGVGFDLPGNGFSDKFIDVLVERGNGVLERFFDAYNLIREKGVFWAFDNMVETGEVPYEKIMSHYSSLKTVAKPIVLGSDEMGRVLGEVIETMGLAPVHLVLHDSSFGMVANWVLENLELVRSVTIVDAGSKPALPLWVLEMPVVREIVLGSNFAYRRLVEVCCSKGVGGLDLEANRMVLKGRDGRRAVVGSGQKLNSSFSVVEWGGLDGVKGLPIQVIWSNSWSKEWNDEGRKIAEALPHAKFVWHSGGRWSQEDAADEVADNIVKFVSSLPKSVRKVEEEPIQEHIQKMFDVTKEGGDNHHHHHHGHGDHDHHHGHAHIYAPGYMNSFGLDHGWGT